MPIPAIVAPLFTSVDTAVSGFMLTGASNVAAAAVTPFRTLVTVYIFLWGIAMWRGLIDEPLGDAVGRMFRIVLIGAIALGAGVYGPIIASFLYNTPAEMASTLMGGPTSPETVMDTALNQGNDIALGFMSITSLSIMQAISDTLAAIVVWLFTGLVVLYGTALILLSKVALGIVIAIGPIFIAMLLFDSTKNFFQAWLNQAINFLLIFALVVAVVVLMFTLWTPTLAFALKNSGAGFSALIPMIIVGGTCLVVLWQVSGIASGLAGGVQIGTLGAVGWAANKLSRGAGGARRGLLRRETYRRADGTRSAEWRGAIPVVGRGTRAVYRSMGGRANSVAKN